MNIQYQLRLTIIYLMLVLMCSLITACSSDNKSIPTNDADLTEPASSILNSEQSNTPPTVKVKARSIIGKSLKGDYTRAGFQLDDRPDHSILGARMSCANSSSASAAGENIDCSSRTDINKVSSGVYQMWLVENDSKAMLFCEMLEYNHGDRLNVTMTSKSSGSCVLSEITTHTKLSETEIKTRIKNLLNEPNALDYDLEETIYDLVWYFHQDGTSYQQDIKLLSQAILDNKPLPENNKSTINGSMTPLK